MLPESDTQLGQGWVCSQAEAQESSDPLFREQDDRRTRFLPLSQGIDDVIGERWIGLADDAYVLVYYIASSSLLWSQRMVCAALSFCSL